jgi:hypothetical protein
VADEEAAPKNMGNPVRTNQSTKIKQMRDIPKEARNKAPKKVQELTVRDLEDLALKFQGAPTQNAVIDKLEVTDLQALEDVFASYKSTKAEALQEISSVAEIADIEAFCTESCCCCTPCCCCAAAVADPIRL